MSRSLAVESPTSTGNISSLDQVSLKAAKLVPVPITLNGQPHQISPLTEQPTEQILDQISSSLGKSLPLSEIIAGHGADPRNEIFNHAYGGAEIVDPAGNQFQLLYWFDPEADENTALGISLTQMSNGQETWVSNYRLKGSFSELEAKLMSERLFRAMELLGSPETFEAGLGHLQLMRDANCLEQDIFELTVETPQFNSENLENELSDWLRRKEVAIDSWGRGEAKSLSCLAKELRSGEGDLSFENGDIYLSNRVVMLWVETPDGSKRIVELCQEFTDGRPSTERIRLRRNLGGLLAEKLSPHETPQDAVLRGLKEELGISKVVEIEDQGVSRRLEKSMCFPGLIKRNLYHVFRVVIPPSEEKPRYKETSTNKNTYFGWMSV